MDDPCTMRMCQRGCDRQCCMQNDLAIAAAAQLRQVAAGRVLHRDPGVPRRAMHTVDSQNIRVIERPNVLVLALQGRDCSPILHQIVAQDLQRDEAAALAILRKPDFAATACPQTSDENESRRQFLPALQHDAMCRVERNSCAYPPPFGAGAAGAAAGATAGVWTGRPVSFS